MNPKNCREVESSQGITRHMLMALCVCSLAGVFQSIDSFADENPSTVLPKEKPLSAEDREHWAFKPILRPEVPAVKNKAWINNPIDQFILARLEAAGLEPMTAAKRTTLIRRVSFDLTGLPPRPKQVDQFLADKSPGAYARLVDRLLASPEYGVRWGQHWLDLARFAETDGFEHDKVRPNAWRYRDWVVNALNSDMPYNEFVRRQLAGDLLYPADPKAKIATGFLLCGPDMPDINSQVERRHTFLNDMTATVGSSLLGLQMGCAQCHDHKFDPISQFDFYRLRAFFDSMDLFRQQLVATREEMQKLPEKKLPKARAVSEKNGKRSSSYVWLRGDYRQQGPEIAPAVPRIADLPPKQSSSSEADNKQVSNRVALVDWIVSSRNPLTTRIIMNRVWQHHFGRGLVTTPSDFGIMGISPTHPRLLDWLATELPRQNWSLKSMHRLIVNSATYQQSSRPRQNPRQWKAALEKDRENRLYSRMNRRRLEGEAVRDAMLASSNSLVYRKGGPGIRPPLPEELLVTLLKNQWPVTPNPQEHRRRSLYLFVRRNLRYPIFDVFDRPDTNQSCPQRNLSTTAPQALMLLNSELSLSAARRLAGFIIQKTQNDSAMQIRICFRRTLHREPTEIELKRSVQFLTTVSNHLRKEGHSGNDLAGPIPTIKNIDPYSSAALVNFCLAVFNLNEFIYID